MGTAIVAIVSFIIGALVVLWGFDRGREVDRGANALPHFPGLRRGGWDPRGETKPVVSRRSPRVDDPLNPAEIGIGEEP